MNISVGKKSIKTLQNKTGCAIIWVAHLFVILGGVFYAIYRRIYRKSGFFGQTVAKMECPFGFEVVDTRYGGKVSRIATAQLRLAAYLNGQVDALPELEEVRRIFSGQGKGHSYNAVYSAYNH